MLGLSFLLTFTSKVYIAIAEQAKFIIYKLEYIYINTFYDVLNAYVYVFWLVLFMAKPFSIFVRYRRVN